MVDPHRSFTIMDAVIMDPHRNCVGLKVVVVDPRRNLVVLEVENGLFIRYMLLDKGDNDRVAIFHHLSSYLITHIKLVVVVHGGSGGRRAYMINTLVLVNVRSNEKGGIWWSTTVMTNIDGGLPTLIIYR